MVFWSALAQTGAAPAFLLHHRPSHRKGVIVLDTPDTPRCGASALEWAVGAVLSLLDGIFGGVSSWIHPTRGFDATPTMHNTGTEERVSVCIVPHGWNNGDEVALEFVRNSPADTWRLVSGSIRADSMSIAGKFRARGLVCGPPYAIVSAERGRPTTTDGRRFAVAMGMYQERARLATKEPAAATAA